MTLPFLPEPINTVDAALIYENQTAILEWLKSLGHEIDDEKDLHRTRGVHSISSMDDGEADGRAGA